MNNEQIDIKHFEEKLLEEKGRLIKELQTVGRINPDNPSDWQPVPSDPDAPTSDKNDYADSIEGYEENTAILKELESELKEVNDALVRIEKGTYGICEVSGKQIPLDRLGAYPAARTTIENSK